MRRNEVLARHMNANVKNCWHTDAAFLLSLSRGFRLEEGSVATNTLNRDIPFARILLWVALGMMGAFGIIGILSADLIPWVWTHAPLHEISDSLLTAAILGATADRFFHAELSRDVFRAAFRYVLPDEIKEEVNRIINYRLICVRHDSSITIERLENGLIRVIMKSERKIKNISKHTETVKNLLNVDDWGFDNYHPKVIECYMLTEGGEKIDAGPTAIPHQGAIGRFTQNRNLGPSETITFVSVGYEIKRDNDDIMVYYRVPTLSPEIAIFAPADIDYFVNFGVPEAVVTPSPVLGKFRLEGTQFPGQHTRVRWWPKDQKLAGLPSALELL
jgi:hypothetical protein